MSRIPTKAPTSVADEFAELIDRINVSLSQLTAHIDKSSTNHTPQHLRSLYDECLAIRQQLSVDNPAGQYQFKEQTDLIERAMSTMNQVEALHYPELT